MGCMGHDNNSTDDGEVRPRDEVERRLYESACQAFCAANRSPYRADVHRAGADAVRKYRGSRC